MPLGRTPLDPYAHGPDEPERRLTQEESLEIVGNALIRETEILNDKIDNLRRDLDKGPNEELEDEE